MSVIEGVRSLLLMNTGNVGLNEAEEPRADISLKGTIRVPLKGSIRVL